MYNVTDFLEGHPGGPDIILMTGGKDVTSAMRDPAEHEHSEFAFKMLEDYLVGQLSTDGSVEAYVFGTPAINCAVCTRLISICPFSPGRATCAEMEPDEAFLDITKPLFMQMWNNNFTKEYYLQQVRESVLFICGGKQLMILSMTQVHIARHVKDGSSAPIFGGFLEYFTLTPWYVVPLIWLPLSALWFSYAAPVFAWPVLALCFAIGLAFWTLMEYTVHRFLFHIDGMYSAGQFACTLSPTWRLTHVFYASFH